MYIYMYIHLFICLYIYIYMYIYTSGRRGDLGVSKLGIHERRVQWEEGAVEGGGII